MSELLRLERESPGSTPPDEGPPDTALPGDPGVPYDDDDSDGVEEGSLPGDPDVDYS